MRSLWLALLLSSEAVHAQNCPFLGPVFPAPTALGSSTSFASNLTTGIGSTLSEALASGNSSYGPIDNGTAYAIQVFSADCQSLLWDFYHTGNASFSTSGTQTIDGDSIFRIGSISKLLTVYILLAEIGDSYWQRPVTDFLPELKAQSSEGQGDSVDYVIWDDVSLGALASQMSGIMRDLDYVGGLTSVPDITAIGFPPLFVSDLPPCLANSTAMCNKTQLLAAASTRRPVFAPWSTPIYSNTNFQILAFALEAIAGTDFPTMMQRSLINTLNLIATTYSNPNDTSNAVIPDGPVNSAWNFDFGNANPEGGFDSSANDLSTIRRSILSSALLSPNVTRGWLRPITHTSRLTSSVGRPWEIFRYTKTIQNRIIDIYTKSGDLGVYHSTFAIIPEYNVGFVTLTAGSAGNREPISAIILDTLIPSLENAAREQADSAFAGTYTARNGVNSSITLSTDPEKPGLGITEWVSNETDFLAIWPEFGAAITGAPVVDDMRLYPTDLQTSYTNGTERVSWRLLIELINDQGSDVGVYPGCSTWENVDAVPYGNLAFDSFVFTMEDGVAEGLSPQAFKIELMKVIAVGVNSTKRRR